MALLSVNMTVEPEPSFDPLSDPRQDLQDEIQFSGLLTAFCFMVCLSGVGLLLWSVATTDLLADSPTASRDLERLASRMLSFESRLPELSSFEQMMFRLGGQDGDTQEHIRLWYEELVDLDRHPLDGLYLGVLTGEAGLKAELMHLIAKWDNKEAPDSLFQRLLQVVYIHDEAGPSDYETLQAQLAEWVPGNWFYFHVAQRLAESTGDRVLGKNLQIQFKGLTDPLLWRWRVLLIIEMMMIGLGLIFFFRLGVARRNGRITSKDTKWGRGPSPWTFAEGMAVLARGGALTIFLIGLVAVMPQGLMFVEHYGSILLYVPTVVLTAVVLCRPKKQSLFGVLGCSNPFQRIRSSFPILVSVIALGLLGDWLIMVGGEAIDFSVHWTEWFLPQLIWGSQAELWKTSIEFVLLAPLFEELIFRGLLFTTFRAKFNFPISMLGSAFLFALAHGYGIVAFLAVFWSGLLWAWAYERTGSVLPGICAHAVNNGLVVYSLVAFFR